MTATKIDWRPTDTERDIYEHYLQGSTRGDLYVFVKRGRLGVMKPERSQGNAFAAWKAGEELTKQKAEA